jgi:hypothetical protein
MLDGTSDDLPACSAPFSRHFRGGCGRSDRRLRIRSSQRAAWPTTEFRLLETLIWKPVSEGISRTVVQQR